MPNLAVLHVVSSINQNTGGPAASVTGLAAALASGGVRTSIVTLEYVEHGHPMETPEAVNVSVVTPSALGKRLRGWSPALGAAISDTASKQVDIIHQHGLWMYPGIYARRTSNRLGLPLVISPRGMLDPRALERSTMRKAFASLAYERRNLRAARLLHATSDMEAESIRRYGLTQPIAVIPNGVALPDDRAASTRESLESRFPELRGRRWLLFMGRLHPHKGLDMLLAAWRVLHAQFPDWHLLIAGADLTGLRAGLEAAVAGEPAMRESTTFAGMLDGLLKHSALTQAELFVLPTRSESFGIAVAEALAYGMPVITTREAPWSDLVAHECGWWVESERIAIAEALRSAMSLAPTELRVMGERGRRYAAEKFSWDTIGARMAEVYRWIVAGGPLPASVRDS